MTLNEKQKEVIEYLKKHSKRGQVFNSEWFYPARNAQSNGIRRLISGSLVKLGYIEKVMLENGCHGYKLTDLCYSQ